MADEVEIDMSLSHFGVRGMRWGSKKARPSGGSSSGTNRSRSSGSNPGKHLGWAKRKKRKRTPGEQARYENRLRVGKEVAKAVLITTGTVAVASVAGPLVAAGAGAVARTMGDAFSTTTTVRTTQTATIPGYDPVTTRTVTVENN